MNNSNNHKNNNNKINKPNNYPKLTTMTLVGALCSQVTVAQNSVELETVTISEKQELTYKKDRAQSPKTQAPLKDTPRSITVITEELMKDRGQNSVTEVLRTTPGITLGAGEGGTPLGDRPFIRGFEASTDIHIDGMRDLGRISYESFNLESLEISKGPNSTNSGRGSTGGSINLVNKTAKKHNAYAGSIAAGTNDLKRATVDANYYVDEQDIAMRINLMAHNSGVAGRDVVKLKRYGVAPTVTWGLAGDTQITASFYNLHTDDIPDQGHPVSHITNKPASVARNNFYGLKDRDFRKTNAQIYTLNATHHVNDGLNIRNVIRQSRSSQDYVMSRPIFTPAQEAANKVQRGFRSRYVVNKSLVNQTDIYGELDLAGMQHNYVAGIELSREKITNYNKYVTPSGADLNKIVGDLYNPNPKDGGWYIKRGDGSAANIAKIDVNAVYVMDQIALTDKILLNLGARFDDYEANSIDPKDAKKNKKRKDNMLNYQIGTLYKLNTLGNIYLNYATSMNPSGENTQSGGADGAGAGNLGGSKDQLKPEKNRSLELGTKWDLFDEHLQLDLALFQTIKTDARVDEGGGIMSNAGKQEVNGIELNAQGQINNNWSLFSGYTYLNKATAIKAADPKNNGKRIHFIAPNSFNLWSNYRLAQFNFGLGAGFVDKRYISADNTKYVDEYWRLDAMFGYQINPDMNLRLNVQNLTNKTIYDASHVGMFAIVAPGRSADLTFDIKF